MAMENTYRNSTTNIEGHIKVLKQEFKNWPRGLGLDRIRALRAALLLSTNELQTISNILHKNFVEQIEPESVAIFFIYLFYLKFKFVL